VGASGCQLVDSGLGDRDGVVAVPLEETQRVAAQLKLVKQKEAEAENKVKRGEKLKFWDEAGLLAKGAVRYVD